ncbi:ArsR family transcriptional regulator [Actinomycetota bacterium Odt1-20B]
MIEFRFGVDDLASTSFAYSPLQEAVFSLRAWRDPARYPHQRPWLRRLRPAFERQDTELLSALVSHRLWVPDFLTPRPTRARLPFTADLARLRDTPPELLGPEFVAAYGESAAVPAVVRRDLGRPEVLLERITDALAAYWDSCLAPDWWPRVRGVMEADLAHRGRVLAEQGAAALFEGIDRRLLWRGHALCITGQEALHPWPDADIRLAGRGMVLAPTMFARGTQTAIDPERPPLLVYPARGRAVISEDPSPSSQLRSSRGDPIPSSPLRSSRGDPVPVSGHALDRLLGAPRARLLLLLAEPASTTELAHRLGVTPGAVSQHLAVLYDAGLLSRVRAGRSVRYGRTGLGDELCR